MDDDALLLSGIQHFAFCPRQWALIHLEQQWQENERTMDGHIFHKRAHQGPEREFRGDRLTLRGFRIFSYSLGISGICDVVECYRDEQGVQLTGHDGRWRIRPVEYKRGEPKADDVDKLQLCAQAICLEEMLLCSIPQGDLFYGETRRRENVLFDSMLRDKVASITMQMRSYAQTGYTPRPKRAKRCNACSLRDLCLPQLEKTSDVSTYIRRRLEEDE